MAQRWEFGERALEQTERFAALARRVSTLALQQEGPSDALEALITELEVAERALGISAPSSDLPRVGPLADGDGRAYVDHARDVGAFNPMFPEYTIDVVGDAATGTVRFPIAYEGPPGLVHGGFLAVFFDCVIQHHNCDAGTAGKTTALELSYHAPTPLETNLTFELDRVVTDRRIESTGRLFAGEVLCASAEMRAFAGNRANLPAVSPRRPL